MNTLDIAHKTARHLAHKIGIDADDAQSGANYYGWLAINGHDGRCPLNAWIRLSVRRGLVGERRREARRNALLPRNYDYDVSSAAGQDQRIERLLIELSDDARHVVLLLIDPPVRLVERLSLQQRWREHDPATVLPILAKWLRGEGWTKGKIKQTFNEIREAVQS